MCYLMQKEDLLRRSDVDLLFSLYKYRALTVQQLAKRHNYSVSHMYKKMRRLYLEGFVLKESIRGLTKGKGRQGDFYRLGSRGLRVLKEIGYDINREYEASDLRVSEFRLPFLLITNDLALEMESHGWGFMDSRLVKSNFNLNRSDNLHGALIEPKSETYYPFYVFNKEISPKTMGKIRSEIGTYNFSNLLLLTRSKESFMQMTSEFINSSDIVKYFTFKVMPFGYGKHYLLKYVNESNLYHFLKDKYGFDVAKINHNVSYETGLERIVKHNGEEKYLVNLLDNDLKKIYQIKSYRKENYEMDGRRVLVLTNMYSLHKELLKHVHHVDFLKIDSNALMNHPLP